MERTFPGIRHVGCFYHYSKNIRKNITERIINNLTIIDNDNLEYNTKIENCIVDLLSILFKIKNNNKIKDLIFAKYKEKIFENFK